jgi:hypothetical protein
MSLTSPDPFVLVTVTVLAVGILLATGKVWSRWQLKRWCNSQGLELVTWQGAAFYEGPGAWVRSENQDAYRIEVRDRQGRTRTGWVVFGRYWAPWSNKVRVEWD